MGESARRGREVVEDFSESSQARRISTRPHGAVVTDGSRCRGAHRTVIGGNQPHGGRGGSR
jgi:hypothetical protein